MLVVFPSRDVEYVSQSWLPIMYSFINIAIILRIFFLSKISTIFEALFSVKF